MPLMFSGTFVRKLTRFFTKGKHENTAHILTDYLIAVIFQPLKQSRKENFMELVSLRIKAKRGFGV
jgi:hypothetical protein